MKILPGKKIPAFLGLFFVILGLILTLLLVKQGSIFNTGATASQDPQDIRITNVTDTSFTVSYTTSASVLGTLNFNTSSISLDNVALDDRDQLSQTVNKYTVHSITVRGIQADTTYFFQINSGDKKYINGSSPYSVKTGKVISSDPPDQSPMSGKVLEEDGKAAPEALVYVKTNGAQDLSTLTKPDGSYTIPLNSLRVSTLDGYYVIPSDSILSIEVLTNSSSAHASTSFDGINPVPPITLSQSYDFSTTQVAATVNNPQASFPNVGEKAVSATPAIQSPTDAISPTMSPSPTTESTTTPTERVIAENISPTLSEEAQPTIPPTGNSSVIINGVFGSILLVMGLLIFLTTGRKIHL